MWVRLVAAVTIIAGLAALVQLGLSYFQHSASKTEDQKRQSEEVLRDQLIASEQNFTYMKTQYEAQLQQLRAYLEDSKVRISQLETDLTTLRMSHGRTQEELVASRSEQGRLAQLLSEKRPFLTFSAESFPSLKEVVFRAHNKASIPIRIVHTTALCVNIT